MPPVYVATGLSVNSTIAYCSGAGVLPFPLPGVALAIPVSNAPNMNIIPIVMALALTRCADVASPPLIGEPNGDRRPPDVRRPQKSCAKSNWEFRSSPPTYAQISTLASPGLMGTGSTFRILSLTWEAVVTWTNRNGCGGSIRVAIKSNALKMSVDWLIQIGPRL